jgi:hypothetical protein
VEEACSTEMLVCKSIWRQEAKKHQNKKISTKRRKHKIIIIGDNHRRDCASEVKYDLDNKFQVQGVIKPGTGLMTVTKQQKVDVKNLTERYGGSVGEAQRM